MADMDDNGNRTSPLLVMAGLPALSAQLVVTALPRIDVDGVAELLATLKRPDVKQRRDIVFFFADNLAENGTVPLTEVLRRLTGAGYSAVIVAITARGGDLSRQHPKAGLLPAESGVNDVLYALSTFGYHVEPVNPRAGANDTAPTPPVKTVDERKPVVSGWGTPPGDAPSAPAQTPESHTAPRVVPQPAMQPSAQPAAQPAPRPVAPINAFRTGGSPAPQPATSNPARPALFAPQPATPAAPPAQHPPAPVSEPARTPMFAPATTPQPGPPGALGPVARVGSYTSTPASTPRQGHVITVGAAKGGVGKSSLTLNLGAFLGMRLRSLGKTVCVVDLSFQQADAGKYLGQFTPNIATIAENPSLLTRERILEALVHKPEYNLSVLLGPETPDRGNPLAITPELYVEAINLLKHHYSYILLDTPVAEKFHDIHNRVSLPTADYVISLVTPNYPTMFNVDNWLRDTVIRPKHAGGAGFDPSRVGIVLNRAEEGIGCDEDDVRATMANWNFIGVIPESKEWKRANNEHELVAPKSFVELNEAFASILYAATGEQILIASMPEPERRGGVKNVLGKILGRR